MTIWQRENVFIKRILMRLQVRVRRNRIQIRLPALQLVKRPTLNMRENPMAGREANLPDRARNPLPNRAANRPASL